MRTAVGLLAPAVLVSVLLAGCADDSPADEEEAAPTASSTGTPPPDAVRPSQLPSIEVPSDLASIVDDYNKQQQGPTLGPMIGADVSWPQCPEGMGIPEKQGQGQPMPTDAAEFVVIGLTNSPSFTRNPCLADQLAWARERDLLTAAYSIVTFPDDATLAKLRDDGPYDGATRLGALRNVGYQAALFNRVTMADEGFESPIVWIDVEPVASFEWSDDVAANAAVVEGTVRGYRDRGLEVGFYSLPSMWSSIVGDLRLEAPEWRPAGVNPQRVARERCGDEWSFQGGRAIFGQWVQDHRDFNLTCPGVRLERDRWFHTN